MVSSASAETFGLSGRVCVVTGAASGIGRGVALAVAGAGGRVAILDRSFEGAKATLDEIEGAGAAIACDVSDPASVAKSRRADGGRAGSVRSAGQQRRSAQERRARNPFLRGLERVAVDQPHRLFPLRANLRPADAGGPKGVLVRIASIAAHHATPYSGAYSVAKAGVAMLSRQLAIEWAPYGVRSNVVNPGMIFTPLSQSIHDPPGVAELRAGLIPSGRIGRPSAAAEAVLFLASDRSAYINGDEITVDGGFTRNLMNLVPRAGYERPAG